MEPMAKAPSPEEMQGALKMWGDWIGKFMATGEMVDGGDGLKETGKVVRGGGIVSDGPFMEAKEILGGYSIVQVPSYDRAVAIVHPAQDDDGNARRARVRARKCFQTVAVRQTKIEDD